MNEDIFHLGVKALIKNKQNKILLLKVNNDLLRGYSGEPYWDIPGGRIQKNQTIEETLQREVDEETGIKEILSVSKLDMVLSKIRIPIAESSVGLILAVYICTVPEDIEINLSGEHTSFEWFNPQEASKLLEIKYPKEFCKKISQL